jgi:Zn-dependent protease with chaperone function
MDFFESQERAKRNTGWLVALFFLALAATVASVHVLASLAAGRGTGSTALLDPGRFLLVGGGVLAVVLVGTLVKWLQMSHGGPAVAAALGGRQIDPGTGDPAERRVLNVVEEMALASGVRVPPVYIMEDGGINAFAAGNSGNDAVIGVTRGCVEKLTRDELQGVMAHEFSHIFHRDMRLNMRLVAWLGGIFAISMVGRMLLRAAANSRGSRGKNDGRAVMAGIGIALFIVGIIGYFFGRLIQAAVSRQREYLADASAVQYTRNPDGIAGALEKIAAGTGSELRAPAAAEFSHFLFASGIASLFSTHPPLEDRIARIRGSHSVAAADVPRMAAPGEAPPHAVPAADVRAARSAMGSLTPGAITCAEDAIARIPAPLADAVRNPFDARAAVCLLLLSPDDAERRRQFAVLASCDAALADATRRLAGAVRISAGQRLAVLELAAASLALLSPAQYASFRTALAHLVAADGQVDRLEWTVRVLLRQAVESRGAAPGRGIATDDDLAMVVSVLAWSGAQDGPAAMRAWAAARSTFGRLGPSPVPASRCTLDALDASLRAFAGSSPAMRRRLVDACVAAVTADGRTTVEEAELLRAVCAAVGAPMPPVTAAA